MVEFNEARALEVFKILDDYYRNRRGLYGVIVLPQEARPLPSKESRQLSNWFFFAAHFMRGGVVNDTQFKFFWHIFAEFPEIFEPGAIYWNWPPERIIEESFKYVAGKINGQGKSPVGVLGFKMREHMLHLHHNMGILHHCWDDDLLNVFAGAKNFEEAFARIDYERSRAGFLGMRRKIFSLLTIWLQEAGLINDFPTPIPVDFHAMRMLLQTETVKNSDMQMFGMCERYPFLAGRTGMRVKESFVNLIALWTQNFLAEAGISHKVINPALWILSRELCAGHFQARPIGGWADKYLEVVRLENTSTFWPKNYRDPCAFCPVEAFCEFVVPSAPYYRWGLLVKLRRIAYPGKRSLLPGLQNFIIPPLAKSRRKVINSAR